MSTNYSFEGKKVLVTGGGREIGLAIAKAFYAQGAIVNIIDKDEELLKKVKEELPNVNVFCVDLLNWAQTQKVIESMGHLDHLVNNAGVISTGLITEATEEQIDLVYGVNVKGTFNCGAIFARMAQEKNTETERTIVNISSVGDRAGSKYLSIYCSSKASVSMLTRCMAIEFAPLKIRVNAICPGFLDTQMSRSLGENVMGEAMATCVPRMLCGQLEKEDIAQNVLYLSSPLSSKITGTSLVVDSGLLASG